MGTGTVTKQIIINCLDRGDEVLKCTMLRMFILYFLIGPNEILFGPV